MAEVPVRIHKVTEEPSTGNQHSNTSFSIRCGICEVNSSVLFRERFRLFIVADI